MRINHNIAALNTHRMLSNAQANSASSMEKLSSGLRINRAGDDAAGLSISEKMRGQIRGLEQASRNSQDGISMIQTAEGALNEVHAITQRMRELAVQSANDTNEGTDRTALQNEYTQLAEEVLRIGTETQFNKKALLDGSALAPYEIQVGANSGESMQLDFNTAGIDIVTAVQPALAAIDLSVDSATSSAAIDQIDAQIELISAGRSTLGAWQNRLEHTIANLDNTSENLTASESRIRDVDMAKEMMEQTKNSILAQASQAMLAKANQEPQGVLQLLR